MSTAKYPDPYFYLYLLEVKVKVIQVKSEETDNRSLFFMRKVDTNKCNNK